MVGAQLANSIYATSQRPQVIHAQTALPQSHNILGSVPQNQSVQMGQQYHPAKPQVMYQQQGQPQPGGPQPWNPQQGHPQQGQLQQGQPHQGQPHQGQQQGPPQQGHPQQARPQQRQTHPGWPQSSHPPPGQQNVGSQPYARPPVAQNPTVTAGVAINFNGQGQAQIGFNQQQQYPMMRPATVGNQPPSATIGMQSNGVQGQAQFNVDPNMSAVLIGSTVQAAFRPDRPQQSQQGSHHQGDGQADHAPHSEPHSAGHHEYSTENHAGAQAPTPYAENNYATGDTTYIDGTNSNIYGDNTANNSADADNTAYAETNYVDTTTYSNTDMTYVDASYQDSTAYGGTDVAADCSNNTYSWDESINVASSTDIDITTTDYSGGSWGDFFEW